MVCNNRLLIIMAAACGSALLTACDMADAPASPAPAAPDAVIEDPAAPDMQADSRDPAPQSPAAQDEGTPAPGSPALWTLSDEDTTVHLFGTVHILKPETQWRTPQFDAIFDATDAVYFEADVSSPQAARDMARLVPKLGIYTDGTRLSDVLDENEEREVEEAMDYIGVPMSAIEPMKPWLATVQLSVQALVKQGYSADSGVETVLTEAAEAAGKDMRFLETGEQQLRFFADMSQEDQVEFLVASAVQIEENPQLLDTLVAEWAEGDVEEIGHIMAEPEVMGSQHVYDVLIVERNANWADQIAALMEAEAGTFLIAVGAGHLAGKDSVVEMLRADGFEVEGP